MIQLTFSLSIVQDSARFKLLFAFASVKTQSPYRIILANQILWRETTPEAGMSRLFWLSDEAWAAIEAQLPKNQPGARRVDDRRVISRIIHMLKCGGRWADCPAQYGPSTTVYNRWNRWSRRGVCARTGPARCAAHQ